MRIEWYKKHENTSKGSVCTFAKSHKSSPKQKGLNRELNPGPRAFWNSRSANHTTRPLSLDFKLPAEYHIDHNLDITRAKNDSHEPLMQLNEPSTFPRRRQMFAVEFLVLPILRAIHRISTARPIPSGVSQLRRTRTPRRMVYGSGTIQSGFGLSRGG